MPTLLTVTMREKARRATRATAPRRPSRSLARSTRFTRSRKDRTAADGAARPRARGARRSSARRCTWIRMLRVRIRPCHPRCLAPTARRTSATCGTSPIRLRFVACRLARDGGGRVLDPSRGLVRWCRPAQWQRSQQDQRVPQDQAALRLQVHGQGKQR